MSTPGDGTPAGVPLGHADPGPGARDPAAALPSQGPLVVILVGSVVLASWVGAELLAESYGDAPRLGLPVWVPSDLAVRVLRLCAVLAAGAACALVVGIGRRRATAPVLAALLLVAAGGALVAARGPVYSPMQGLTWMIRLGRYASTPSATASPTTGSAAGTPRPRGANLARPRVAPAVAVAAARARRAYLLGFGGTLLPTVLLGLVARTPHRRRPPSVSHGSARWGDGAELVAARGPWIGRAPAGRAAQRVLRYAGEGHMLTVAPARSGKGVGAVIPNLLTYPGSVIVTDLKGENYEITGAHRRVALEQEVIPLDPFGVVTAHSARFNPLSIITPGSPDAIDDANLLADLLVVRSGGDEGHWDDEAHALLAGLIYFVGTSPDAERRTLARVRELLTLRPDDFEKSVMQAMRAAGGLAARAAARLEQKADRERSGVISSAQRHTHFLDSPAMEAVLSGNDLDLRTLKMGRVSLYLILPPHRVEAYRRWLRLMIGCALNTMWRTPGQPHERVLFLLDEFGHLGRMRPIEEAVALVPGYGLSFWFFLQDLSQLKSVYREHWPTFLANCEVLQAFGTNDVDTAEYLSRRLGEATIQVESETRSAGRSQGKTGSRSLSAGQGVSERARRLLTPDEVLRLPPDRQLLVVKGRDPVLARRLSYFRDPEFRTPKGAPIYATTAMQARLPAQAQTPPPVATATPATAGQGGAGAGERAPTVGDAAAVAAAYTAAALP